MKFIITLEKDFTNMEKILPRAGFITYRAVINNLAYKPFIEHLAKKMLKEYNPTYTTNTATFTQESDDAEVLEKELEKLKAFMLGDATKFKNEAFAEKVLNNRWVNKAYQKTTSFISNQLEKRSILTLFNSMSIFITWKIIK